MDLQNNTKPKQVEPVKYVTYKRSHIYFVCGQCDNLGELITAFFNNNKCELMDTNTKIVFMNHCSEFIINVKDLRESLLLYIIVTHVSGKTIILKINEDNTIKDVREMVCKQIKIPSDKINLLLNRVKLCDNEKISDYNIKNWTMLHIASK